MGRIRHIGVRFIARGCCSRDAWRRSRNARRAWSTWGAPLRPRSWKPSRLPQRRAWCGSRVIGTGTACNTLDPGPLGEPAGGLCVGGAELRVPRGKTRLPSRQVESLHGGGGAEVTRARAPRSEDLAFARGDARCGLRLVGAARRRLPARAARVHSARRRRGSGALAHHRRR